MSDRFSDPLGDHIQLLTAEQERRVSNHPPVNRVYEAFYASIDPQTKEGMSYLAGAEGIIGGDLELRQGPEGLVFVARTDGRTIATPDVEAARHIEQALARGWEVRCVLSLITYTAADKGFHAEYACFCYDATTEEACAKALETFIQNLIRRITSGMHPGLKLNQIQFAKVMESGGDWYLTKELPWPELEKGSVFYRRRRTASEGLIAVALEHNKGCSALSWFGLVLLIGLIAGVVWLVFSRSSG
jgi:hypothetical protein